MTNKDYNGLNEEYDSVVAVHGFDPMAPQNPDTKDFKTVAQDRIREGFQEVQRREGNDTDVLFVLTGGSYKEELDSWLDENDHRSVEDYDLPSESELMKNQLEWMYTGHGDKEEGRLDADETGWDNEHGDYIGSLEDINADIVLESESQDTSENINYLKEIVKSSGASELYTITSSDHAGRAGDTAHDKIEMELDEEGLDVSTYSKRSKLGYSAPKIDEDGNIIEVNPDKVDLEPGNKLRPIVDKIDGNIWDLFGKSREEIDRKAEEIGNLLSE